MADKKRSNKKKMISRKSGTSLDGVLSIYAKIAEIKQQLEKSSEKNSRIEDRLEDLEIHVNLLTRLLTTLCVEKFGIRVGVLKHLVRRIEKEAVRDSQIVELESIYRLSHEAQKKAPASPPKPKEDPWDKIS